MSEDDVDNGVQKELTGVWDHICRLCEQESETPIRLSSPDNKLVKMFEGLTLDCHDFEELSRELVCTCHESGDLVFAPRRSYGCPHDEYITALKSPEYTLRRVCRRSESLEECRRRLSSAADNARTSFWLPRGG